MPTSCGGLHDGAARATDRTGYPKMGQDAGSERTSKRDWYEVSPVVTAEGVKTTRDPREFKYGRYAASRC